MECPSRRPLSTLVSAVAIATPGLLAGCGGSGQDPSFESGGPIGRTKAIGDAASSGDPGAIPQLIESLWSADPAERMLAIRALESMTGQTLGYRFADPEQKRTEAANRWVSWWRSEAGDPADARSRPFPPSGSPATGATRGR